MSERTTSSNKRASASGAGPQRGGTFKILPRGNSCFECRRRKLKCDSARPACSQCVRYKRPQLCQYEQRPKTQVEALQERVQELETLLAAAAVQPSSQAPPSPIVPSLGRNEWSGPQTTPFEPRFLELVAPDMGLQDDSNPASQSLVVPEEVKEHLFDTFCRSRHRVAFGPNMMRLTQGLWADEGESPSPNISAALLNAMWLLGCYFDVDQAYSQWEEALHSAALRHLNDGLTVPTDVIEFLQATVLVAFYAMSRGNIVRGSYLASSAMNFAVGCNLHMINFENPFESSGSSVLPAPTTREECIERINIFGAVYWIDRKACLLNSLVPSLAVEDIKTPWPMSYLPETVRTRYDLSMGSLFDNNGSGARVPGATVTTVRLKGLSLMEAAERLARASARTISEPSDPSFWDRFVSLNQAIDHFSSSLPPHVRNTGGSSFGASQNISLIDDESTDLSAFMDISPGSAASAAILARSQRLSSTVPDHNILRHTILCAHLMAKKSTLRLHGIFADRDANEQQIALAAAKDTVSIILAHGEVDSRHLDSSCAPALSAAALVLAREWFRLCHIDGVDGLVILNLAHEISTLKTAWSVMAAQYPWLHLVDEDMQVVSAPPYNSL